MRGGVGSVADFKLALALLLRGTLCLCVSLWSSRTACCGLPQCVVKCDLFIKK